MSSIVPQDPALDELETRVLSLLDADHGAPSPAELADRAIGILEFAAYIGEPAWRRVLEGGLLFEIERLLSEPSERLAGLEQELFAPPDVGLQERAAAMVEALGRRERSVARDAERLLHATGESIAAYRIERSWRSERPLAPRRPVNDSISANMRVTVAGGHARLRKAIGLDLRRGLVRDLREVAPAFEATRGGRSVAATLANSDLVVLIARQINHSTADQVTAAANRAGVPVAYATSAGIGGVRREVEAFARAGWSST